MSFYEQCTNGVRKVDMLHTRTERKFTRRVRFGVSDDGSMPYTADELEFMLAMERYKTEQRRPFPAWSEVLAVVRELGYRKGTADQPVVTSDK